MCIRVRALAFDFKSYFSDIWPHLDVMAEDGLIALGRDTLDVLPAGRLLVRAVCKVFDSYLLRQHPQQFSKVI